MSAINDRIYFAYGSNMNAGQMEFRCPGAEPVGVGILRDYRFIINCRGVASVEPLEGSIVQGILWKISDEHELTLDRFEGIERKLYYKTHVIINISDTDSQEAMIYIASENEHGNPREGYLEIILEGAHHFKLSKKYIDELESWAFSSRNIK